MLACKCCMLILSHHICKALAPVLIEVGDEVCYRALKAVSGEEAETLAGLD